MRVQIKSGLGEIKASKPEVNKEKTEVGAEHCDPAAPVKATHLLTVLQDLASDAGRGGTKGSTWQQRNMRPKQEDTKRHRQAEPKAGNRKAVVGCFIRLLTASDRQLWTSKSPTKRKKKLRSAYRLLGMSSIKEAAMWRDT
jgi:hypothetical protein